MSNHRPRMKSQPGPHLPNDPEAERAVLASVLLNGEALDRAMEFIGPEDFYFQSHRDVFEAMRQLSFHRIAIDPITVADQMSSSGQRVEPVFFSELYDLEPTWRLVGHYAEIVKRKSLQRRVSTRLQDYGIRASEPDVRPEELLAELDMELNEMLGDSQMRMGVRATSADLTAVIEQARAGQLAGWSTGFNQFDDICGGFYPGDLVIVAGATSVGKSILALNIAEHFAFCKRRVAFFSIEMALAQLVRRVLSSRSDVALSDVRKAGLTPEWEERLLETCRTLGPALDEELELWDVRHFTPGRFRVMCKAAKARGYLALAVVDFIQLMTTDNPATNKEQEMTIVAQALKGVARELGIVVIAVSQLNLQWSAQQRRPTKEDLKYASSIEQAADTVMLLHTEKGEQGTGNRYRGSDKNAPDKLMLLVDKQRNDATTYFYLNHREGRFRFEEE